MSVPEPQCSKRGCRHLTGATTSGRGEIGQRAACHAFPEGIPDDIAYGDNLHLTVDPRQVGEVVFERQEQD